MKQLTIASGKGGTGKTTIAVNLASLAKNAVIVDCDVTYGACQTWHS
ncbi:MAG: P-loop NTPase [Methanocellales archaeon]